MRYSALIQLPFESAHVDLTLTGDRVGRVQKPEGSCDVAFAGIEGEEAAHKDLGSAEVVATDIAGEEGDPENDA